MSRTFGLEGNVGSLLKCIRVDSLLNDDIVLSVSTQFSDRSDDSP